MSKNVENNSQENTNNNSNQNLYLSSHHKNKSSNFSDKASSTQIIVKINPSNSSKNINNKDINNSDNRIYNIYSPKNKNIKNRIINVTEIKKNDKEEKTFYRTSKIAINLNTKDSNNNLLKENHSSPRQELAKKYIKNQINYKMKISKACGEYSANTPKPIVSVFNGLKERKDIEENNILVKKNLKLGIKRMKSPVDNNDKNENKKIMSESNIKNDYVKYVNNDKYNFNGNILNMTQIYKQPKYILSQSKSFTNIEKKNSVIGYNSPNRNNSNNNNGKNKKNHNFNYINYNNYKSNCKKKELTVLTKNNNTFRHNKKEEENNNDPNVFSFQNISTSPNANNNIQSYFNNIEKIYYIKKNKIDNKEEEGANKSKNIINETKNEANDSGANNNQKNTSKNIYIMKPIQKRKRSSYGKNHEKSVLDKDNTSNQTSFRSKYKKDSNNIQTLESSFLSDAFNKNIENPEELHFFYIKILQNGKIISNKFEIDNN